MRKISKKLAAGGILVLVLALASGCGCGKKQSDEKSEKVMEITITPEATPTPAPEAVNPAAVTTNGNLTMVNEYVADGGGQSAEEVLPEEAEGTDDGNEEE